MLTAMFAIFLVQIVARYVLRDPPGWTIEASLILWLWIVFWGSAFCVKDHQHVKFDMIYLAVGRKWQRIFAGLAALSIVVIFIAALPADWDYIDFYKRKKTPVLKIQMNYVFSVYAIFAVAAISVYGWRLWAILTGRNVEGVEIDHLADNLLRDEPAKEPGNGA